MRTRKALAALGVIALTLLGPAVHAYAQEGEPEYKSEVEQACAEKLAQGQALSTCDEDLEAPSPIFPATNELIWGALSFGVLFVLLWKFGFPPLRKGLNDRAERIRTDLDKADTAKAEAEAELARYQSQLKGAREEATRMRDDARAEMEQYRTQRRAEIDAELAEYRDRSKAEADAAKGQALADVKAEVATLAIAAAEQVVQKSLDRDTNVALVEQYIDSVSNRS